MHNTNRAKIHYLALNDEDTAAEKLDWLRHTKPQNLEFEHITPDKNNNWINQTDNDWDTLLCLISKEVKGGKENKAIMKLYSYGLSTNRDEWVYDIDKENLAKKMQFFIEKYNNFINTNDKTWNTSIKWSRDLKKKFEQKRKIIYNEKIFIKVNYRPYTKQTGYAERILNDILTQNHYDIFGENFEKSNKLIMLHNHAQLDNFTAHIVGIIPDAGYSGRGTPAIPRYRYDTNDNPLDNLTDWGLQQFTTHYNDTTITKDAIFDYIYAVLHNPAYRSKYELNLKREFPRIPFYDDFHQWAAWGKALMALHLDYETAEPYPLEIRDASYRHLKGVGNLNPNASPEIFTKVEEPEPMFGYKAKVKVRLKADKTAGTIEIDDDTTIYGIPPEAWDYKLGNRSALEWVLDQYKEKKPTDPTILAHFDTYRFADYKTEVIDLLCRVCTVSVETIRITQNM